MRNRTGQSTVEWLSAAVAVAVLALLVVAALPGAAGAVGGGMQRVVCALGVAGGSGGACPGPEGEAVADVGAGTQARPIIEATGPGGLRFDVAGSGFTDKLLATGGTRASAAGGGGLVTLPVSDDDAKTRFGFDDPERCRSAGPGLAAPQLCSTGTLRQCQIFDPVAGTVRCDRSISDTTLALQATCAAAPNALAADPASEEQLCRVTTDTGGTAIFRCARDTTGDLRRCVDTSQDPFAIANPATVTCPGGATDPVADTRDGRDIWRFDSLCLSSGGSAYLCETVIDRRGNSDVTPPTPVGQPDSCTTRTIPNDPAHGDGRDLLGNCTGQELAPGAPEGQNLNCTLPDRKTTVTCAFLDQTIQHCARAAQATPPDLESCPADPLGRQGRGLQTTTPPTLRALTITPAPRYLPGAGRTGVVAWHNPSPAIIPSPYTVADGVVVSEGGTRRRVAQDSKAARTTLRLATVSDTLQTALDLGDAWFGVRGVDDRGAGIRVQLNTEKPTANGGACNVRVRLPDRGLVAQYVSLDEADYPATEDVILHETGHEYVAGLGVATGEVRTLEADSIDEGFADIFARAAKYARGADDRGRLVDAGGSGRSIDVGLLSHVSQLGPDEYANGGLAVNIFNNLARRLVGQPGLTRTAAARAAERADGVNISKAAALQGLAMKRMGAEPPERPYARASFGNWCAKSAAAAPDVGVDPELVYRTFLDAGIDCKPRTKRAPSTLGPPICSALLAAALCAVQPPRAIKP